MLEGGTPFAGHTPQVILAKKITGVVPEFSAHTSVPATVAAVVRNALTAEPESRYATPAEFAEGLETASLGPIPGSAGSTWAATWATCSRRRRTTFS